MKSRTLVRIIAMTIAVLAVPGPLVAQNGRNYKHKHHHYKFIDMGTLGGPQSYGDAGHGAANINNRGTAAGVADTTAANPYYPSFSPLMQPFGPDPFVFHVFKSRNGGPLVDLGALPGANSSAASFISENGLVVGASLNGAMDPFTAWPEESAVLWKGDEIINLGTLGGYESAAGGVNSHGQVAGFATSAIPDPLSIIYFAFNGFSNGTQTRAFLWDSENGIQDLGTLGGPDAFAPYINERGQIAGLSYTNSTLSPVTGLPTTDPFLWERGRMIDLGTLGGTQGGPGGLNNRGQVAGQSNLAGDLTAHAFLWDKGTLTDIGTPGGTFSQANSLNDAGEVIGGGTTAGDLAFHGFIWRRGLLTDLGTVPGLDCSSAFAINSQSQVVGQAFDCNGSLPGHAFLWEKGHIIDLNVFVPSGSNLILGDSEKLNDRGEIFGSAQLPNGDVHAFLLIPCDEDHGDSECEDEGEGTAVVRGETNQRPNVVLPENVRRMLQQRLGGRYHMSSLGTPKN